jgi:hypothetical protein
LSRRDRHPYYYFGREAGKFALLERNMPGLPLEGVSPDIPTVLGSRLDLAGNSNQLVALLQEADFTMIFARESGFFWQFRMPIKADLARPRAPSRTRLPLF